MSFLGWLAWAVVLIAFALVVRGLIADRRDYTDLAADLDETNAALDSLRVDYAELVAHLTADEEPSTGRHAHTGAAA